MPIEGLDFANVNDLIKFHHKIKENYHNQQIVNYLTYTVCGLLLLMNIVIVARMFQVGDKLFLMTMGFVLLLGEVAGLFVAYCIQRLMSIAVDLKLLIETGTNHPETLYQL